MGISLLILFQSCVCDLVIQASADQPDIGLLVVNILNRDVSDPNPSVRSTAITTICSLPVLLHHSQPAIESGLQDTNVGVRVSAVTGVGKVWRHSPSFCQQAGLVNRLYQILRDPDPSVVTFTLQTLNIVLQKEGGVRVNKKMVRYLLTKIVHYGEREFCFVLDYLDIPDMDQDLRLEILNVLDPFLEKQDGNVVLSVVRLFSKLVENNVNMKSSLIKRITPIFIEFLKSSSHREFNHNMLSFLERADWDYKREFMSHYKVFLLKSKDTEKVKIQKVNFIAELVDENSSMEILNYQLNLLPQNEILNSAIFSSIVKICLKEKSCCYIHGIVNFELLIKTDSGLYIANILSNLKDLKLKENLELGEDRIRQFVKTVVQHIQTDSLSMDQMSSVFYVLGHFSEDIPNSPYILEDVLETDKTAWPPVLYCQLLSCSYQVFLKNPPTMQIILGNILVFKTVYYLYHF